MEEPVEQDERYGAAKIIDNTLKSGPANDSLTGLPPDQIVEQIFTREEALSMPQAPVSATDLALTSAEHLERSSRFLDPVQRHKLIAEAAYFRAMRQGSDQDTPMQNWLAAQVEIDQLFEGERFTEE